MTDRVVAAGEAFSPYWLTEIVRTYVEKAGGCHLFRHTMATLMLERGADIRFIQAMLGHAKLETTSVYTHVSIRKLKEIHELTHPASRLGRREHGDERDGTGDRGGDRRNDRG